jgi:choline dehydrogenase-like flavoprotein
MERWLTAHGVAPGDVRRRAEQARGRARRFPMGAGAVFPIVEAALDRLGPALFQRKACPAHLLDDESFDAFERAVQHHPNALIRAMYTLLRFPALDVAYPDPLPAAPTHPLQALEPLLRERRSHLQSEFDVIVIGSGAGGAPVAWDLSRRGFSVAIVEAGGLLLAEGVNQALERRYLDQGMIGSLKDGGSTIVLAGTAVGGTTVINSGTSLRPRGECLAHWDGLAGTRFAGGELEPWLDAASKQVGVVVPDHSLLSAADQLVEKGLRALGRQGAHVLPRNAPACKGAGRCCFGCPNGAKLSTDRSFLPEAIEAGAVLFAETRAGRIREGATGVEVFVHGPGGRRALRAKKLVMAAGALSTPNLIRESRLGAHWRKAGGQFKMHPASKVFALMPEPLAHGGIPQGLGYRAPELPRITFEGVHTPPGAAAAMVAAAGKRHRWWMERYDRLATYGMMVRDRSGGTVRKLGGIRRIDYGLHAEDAHDLGAAILLTGEIMFAAGAERVLLPVAGMEPEVESVDALRRLRPVDFTRSRLVTCGFHPQGTAGIGRLVDTDLRLVGSEHVYVSDASVLPDSPGVNPQITIMALALRCANTLAHTLEGPWASESARRCQEPTSSAKGQDPQGSTALPSASAGVPTASKTG